MCSVLTSELLLDVLERYVCGPPPFGLLLRRMFTPSCHENYLQPRAVSKIRYGPGKRSLLSVVLYFLIQKERGKGMLFKFKDTSPHRFAYPHSMLMLQFRIASCFFSFLFPKYLSAIKALNLANCPTDNQEEFLP